MQGDGGSDGKSQLRAKKPNKYNEEISSDSETEGCVSDLFISDCPVIHNGSNGFT